MSRSALLVALVIGFAVCAACGRGFLGREYEYEEDLYPAIDGSAALIVNASIPSLVALRGLDIDASPSARADRLRAQLREMYESPVTHVTRVSRPWRRDGRRFVQIRLQVTDIRRLSEAKPFSWAKYELVQQGDEHIYRQAVGPSAMRPGSLKNYGWNGSEFVAFRLHLPSRIISHNARHVETDVPLAVERGNILSWEQHLADRLAGQPVNIDVRMDSRTILHRTLWLFAGAFGAAVLLIGFLIWLTVRKGREDTPTAV